MRIYNKLIIIFLLLSILPMLVVSYIGFRNAKNSLEKEVLSKLDTVAAERARYFESFLHERQADIANLQHLGIFATVFPILEKFSSEPSNFSYLAAKKEIDAGLAVCQNISKYADIMLTDKAGKIIYVSNPTHEFELNTFIADKDVVAEKTKSGVYISDAYRVYKKENTFNLDIEAAVYGQAGEILGFVSAELDIRKIFDDLYNDSLLGETGEIVLGKKTADNKILFLSLLKHKPDGILTKTLHFGDAYALPMQRVLSGGGIGSGRSIDYRGQKVLSAWRLMKLTGWGLVAKIDREEAIAPIVRARIFLFATILLVCLALVLVFLALAKSISELILKFRKGVKIIGSGNLDYKIAINSKDEIGALSQEFDKMTESLKTKITSIENLNKEIAERNKIELQLRANQDELKKKSLELELILKDALKSREIFSSMLDDNNQIRIKLEQSLSDLHAAYTKIQDFQAQIIQSSKMASIGQLAGGVAHEINNPLTGVLNNVQLVKMIAKEKKEFRLEDFEEILNVVEESAMRCKKITQALLDFSRGSTGAYQPVLLNKIIDDVYVLIAQEFKLHNISLQRDFQQDLPFISGDVQLIQQVILGFVSNAQWAIKKKSAKNGGVIIIKTQYETGAKELCFSVSDSGIGIPKENLDRIFLPFFTTKDVGEGTGLGLSIIYGIVKAHSGTVTVESEFGVGTTFKVIFPVIPAS